MGGRAHFSEPKTGDHARSGAQARLFAGEEGREEIKVEKEGGGSWGEKGVRREFS